MWLLYSSFHWSCDDVELKFLAVADTKERIEQEKRKYIDEHQKILKKTQDYVSAVKQWDQDNRRLCFEFIVRNVELCKCKLPKNLESLAKSLSELIYEQMKKNKKFIDTNIIKLPYNISPINTTSIYNPNEYYFFDFGKLTEPLPEFPNPPKLYNELGYHNLEIVEVNKVT